MVFKNPWMPIREDVLRFADGSTAKWYVRLVGKVGCIFAMTDDDHVILVRQYKHGAGRIVIELPTGVIESGESVKSGTIRELREETGYDIRPSQVTRISKTLLSATGEEGERHLFFGRGAVRVGDPLPNPHEAITVVLATLPEVLRYVRNGTIAQSGQIGLVYSALDHIGFFP